MESVRRTIKEHNLIQRGDSIVVGVSGGADSVCLLHMLEELKEEYELALTVVHINHQLRGAAADEDQRFVENLCKEIGISCYGFSFDVNDLALEWGMTTEEAGRKVRYDSFYETLYKVDGNKIAVAQNQNDQAETILMRLMRGTGIDGLAGIGYMRDGIIIRPLLDAKRSEIEDYCREKGIEYRTDLTNLQPIYTRNKIRLDLIPYIEENFNPDIINTLGRLAKTAAEDKSFLYDAVKEAESSFNCDKQFRVGILKTYLKKLHPAIKKRVIRRSFAALGLEQDISMVHLEQAIRIIEEDKTSASIDFPSGYKMKIGYDDIIFIAPHWNDDQDEADDITERFSLECIYLDEKPENLAENEKLFDADKVDHYVGHYGDGTILTQKCQCTRPPDNLPELTLRTRQAGDVFSPLGMKGTKKIKEYFIDEKIPAEERDKVPLVCMGNEVLWVVGKRTSEKYKIDADTKQFLLVRVL